MFKKLLLLEKLFEQNNQQILKRHISLWPYLAVMFTIRLMVFVSMRRVRLDGLIPGDYVMLPREMMLIKNITRIFISPGFFEVEVLSYLVYDERSLA